MEGWWLRGRIYVQYTLQIFVYHHDQAFDVAPEGHEDQDMGVIFFMVIQTRYYSQIL